MRHDVPRNAYFLWQRFALPAQHVGTLMRKALIFEQPGIPARTGGIISRFDRTRAIRHRMPRIGNVAVKLLVAGFLWRIEREMSVAMKIQMALCDIFARRPL